MLPTRRSGCLLDDTLSDEELAELVQGGRIDLWEQLARRVTSMITVLVRQRVPPSDCDDVVQDSLVRFYKALPAYAPAKGTLRSWVWRLTGWQINDYFRQLGPPREGLHALLEQPGAAVGEDDPPDDLVRRISGLVGATTWHAIRLVVLEGYTYREAGERLGLSEAATKMRVRRAFLRLREALGGQDG